MACLALGPTTELGLPTVPSDAEFGFCFARRKKMLLNISPKFALFRRPRPEAPSNAFDDGAILLFKSLQCFRVRNAARKGQKQFKQTLRSKRALTCLFRVQKQLERFGSVGATFQDSALQLQKEFNQGTVTTSVKVFVPVSAWYDTTTLYVPGGTSRPVPVL
jgi:hypothetical protein